MTRRNSAEKLNTNVEENEEKVNKTAIENRISQSAKKIRKLPMKIYHENEEIVSEPRLNSKINKDINKHFRAKPREYNDYNKYNNNVDN